MNQQQAAQRLAIRNFLYLATPEEMDAELALSVERGDSWRADCISELIAERDAEMWAHFNRLQKRVMADQTTKAEFFAQPRAERYGFYNWLVEQCGEYACYM